MKICLFTDTIGDLNGVSRFIQDMAEQALENGVELHVISSTAKYCPQASNIHNFEPKFKMAMPFYKELDLTYPNKKVIKQKVKELNPDMIHISSPGAVGYFGLKLAKELKLPYSGTYHTDFPAYIKDNTGMDSLKKITDKVMAKFYKDFELLFSRSHEYIDILNKDLKFDKEKVKIIKPGTNLRKFNQTHQDREFWDKYDIPQDATIALYVGRTTKEKNIPFLLEVWKEMMEENPELNSYLVLVGEGNLRKEEPKYYNHNVRFLGPIIGKELSTIYASSDFFVFPSITDTLGQVVMESQASGIPVLVSDIGGPQSLIDSEHPGGFVVRGNDKQKWKEAIKNMIQSPDIRKQMGENGKLSMAKLPIEDSFTGFWNHQLRAYEQNGK